MPVETLAKPLLPDGNRDFARRMLRFGLTDYWPLKREDVGSISLRRLLEPPLYVEVNLSILKDGLRLSGLMCNIFIYNKVAGGLHWVLASIVDKAQTTDTLTHKLHYRKFWKLSFSYGKPEYAMPHPLSIGKCRCPSFLNNYRRGIRNCSNHEPFTKKSMKFLKPQSRVGAPSKEMGCRNFADSMMKVRLIGGWLS